MPSSLAACRKLWGVRRTGAIAPNPWGTGRAESVGTAGIVPALWLLRTGQQRGANDMTHTNGVSMLLSHLTASINARIQEVEVITPTFGIVKPRIFIFPSREQIDALT